MGNPILCDDGIGIYIAREVKSRLNRPDVTVIEACLGGIHILELLSGYNKAIIIDATQTKKGRIGQIYKLQPGELTFARHIDSTHDLKLTEALELGDKLGLAIPEDITIYAIEVKDVSTFSENCTPEITICIPVCVDMIIKELDSD